MRIENLEHLIRAAAAITDRYEIVVIGSQSILGSIPNAPSELLFSQEADMFPLEDPALSDHRPSHRTSGAMPRFAA